jgi:Rrf2 family transcriptional regulator, iron-sulfur cluster assembly transcription factor
MNLSCRGRYAARAMVELAIESGNGPVPLSRIAEIQDLSRTYLQQLMGLLKRAGLVRVAQGFKGGFLLAKPAEEVTLADILCAAEGAFSLVDCVTDKENCKRGPRCVMSEVWTEASLKLRDYFAGITLAELAERAKRKMENSGTDGDVRVNVV